MIAVTLVAYQSAFWGVLYISYYQSSFKRVFKDFFSSQRQFGKLLLALPFLVADFFSHLSVRSPLITVLPVGVFSFALLFGGVEEIIGVISSSANFGGTVSFSYFDHLLAWSSWHLSFLHRWFFSCHQLFASMVWLTNCFILSALYHKINLSGPKCHRITLFYYVTCH